MPFNHQVQNVFDAIEGITEEKRKWIAEKINEIMQVLIGPEVLLSQVAEKLHDAILKSDLTDEEKAITLSLLLATVVRETIRIAQLMAQAGTNIPEEGTQQPS